MKIKKFNFNHLPTISGQHSLHDGETLHSGQYPRSALLPNMAFYLYLLQAPMVRGPAKKSLKIEVAEGIVFLSVNRLFQEWKKRKGIL